jgi:hypothetical protein
MKYIKYFILLMIFFQAGFLQAAGERYRVEVLVLTHLEHSESASEVHSLKDYSAALDFLAPPLEPFEEPCEDLPLDSDENVDPLLPEAPSPADLTEELALAEGTEITGPEQSEAEIEEVQPDPNAVVYVSEMGVEMQDAWRRLRLSGPFRPLQYLAWEQGSEAPFPSLRVHDDTVVLTDDPYSDLRLPADIDANFEAGVEAEDAQPSIDGATGELTDCPPPEPSDNLPDPTLYYALDGTVSLVRTRFLHLSLDLQLREARQAADRLAQQRTADRRFDPSRDQSAGFGVHEMQQSRQVRSGRMEYFDGPVIGVLAWVTTIPLEDSEER